MRKPSRIVLALVTALVLAVAAPAIAASFTSGPYVGHTAQKNHRTGQFRKFSFTANASTSRITNLKFTNTGTCSDGGKSSGTQSGLAFNVRADGTFSGKGTSPNGATKLTLSGTITGTKAWGTFKVTSRFNKQGYLDPNGSITCTSGVVQWWAHLSTP